MSVVGRAWSYVCCECVKHADRLTPEKHFCALYIANQVCYITKDMSARTHNIITTECYTNELAAVCRWGTVSVLYVNVNPWCGLKTNQRNSCPASEVKQWNSLFYILNSKLSQGSKHGAMVSTNSQNTALHFSPVWTHTFTTALTSNFNCRYTYQK